MQLMMVMGLIGPIVLVHSISRLSLLVVHSYLWQNMRSKSIAKPTTSGWWRQLGSRTVGAGRAGGAAAPNQGGRLCPPHYYLSPIFWQITLILFKPGGQIMPTTLLLVPPDFQSFLRPCEGHISLVAPTFATVSIFLVQTYCRY